MQHSLPKRRRKQAEMNTRRINMKFTDQIERELVQRFSTQASAFGAPSGALAQSGPWLTAIVVALVATIWLALSR
jgi:hypothetical protein